MDEEELLSLFGSLGPWSILFPSPSAEPVSEADMTHLLGLYRGELIPIEILVSLAPAGVAIEVLVAAPSGRILTRLEPDIERVSWRLNALGQLAFSMALTDQKLRREYLKFSNRILLQFDNGLPPWGGVIGGAYEWGVASVSFEAYSGEILLFRRRTARTRRFYNATVGTIALALLEEANAIQPTGVVPGRIWMGGANHGPEYHRKRIGDVIQDSLIKNLSAEAYDVTAKEEGGYIIFELNLYEQKGQTKPNVGLVAGQNISDVRFRVEDNIANVWYMAGEGSDWGDDDRVYAEAADEASIREYERREEFEVRSGVIHQSTLDATVTKRLRETAWPTRVLALEMLNRPPGRFADYNVGDAPMCILPRHDYDGVRGFFRVLAREFVPEFGVCDLVVQEVAQ